MARRRWRGPIVQYGVQTGDGRIIADGALSWETPLPLAWMVTGTQHTFDGEAPQLGIIDSIETADDTGMIWATGSIDDEIEAGAELIRMLDAGTASHGVRQGVSVDMDDMAVEIIEAAPDVDEDDEDVIVASAVIEGLVTVAGRVRLPQLVAAAGDPLPEDGVVVWEDAQDDVVMNVTRARLRGATCVATPAFADAYISLETVDVEDDDGADDVTAAAGPLVEITLSPPAEWFDDPQLDAPTPLTIMDPGRVFGHVAAWGTPHTGYDKVITPPRGGDYSTFMSSGRVRTDGGYRSTGAFVWGIPHATLDLRLLEAFAHYEIADHGFCDVRVGEDEHGIWFAGALRPHITDTDIRILEALSISGDWRRRGGRMDMIAGLAVNYPGFPIPRDDVLAASVASARFDLDDGCALALVAAGIVPNAAAMPSDAAAWSSSAATAGRVEAKLDTLLARTAHLVPDALAAAAARMPHR